MALPKEIDFNYNVRSLNFAIAFPNIASIEADSYFAINLVISSESSLIHWKFSTLDYDIGFGIYRYHTVSEIPIKEIDQAIKSNKIESIMKI